MPYQPFELTVRDLLDSGSRQKEKICLCGGLAMRGISEAPVVHVGLDATNLIEVSGS